MEDVAVLRKKDKSITWQPYLTNDAKQDIMEIYERLDVERNGYITAQQLHAALNEAFGKPIRAETVRVLLTRMDLTSRHGLKVSHNDFLEYMAQKLLSAESYDDLLRSEQGPLMQEVGYKLYELLERFKRKQMLKDAMAGIDGIQRLLHLTAVPTAHRNRRKGPSGSDVTHNETSANGDKGGGPSGRSRARRSGTVLSAGADPASSSGPHSRSVGDSSFASRSSAVSRRNSGTGGDNSLAPAGGLSASALGVAPRTGNPRNSGKLPRSRPPRNSAPPSRVARASSALVSLLSRMEGQDVMEVGAAQAVEDTGSSQRWRKSVSHSAGAWLAEGVQAAPARSEATERPVSPLPTREPSPPVQLSPSQQQQQQQQPLEFNDSSQLMDKAAHTSMVIRPLSSNASMTHNSSACSQSGSPQTGLETAAASEAGQWPQRWSDPHPSHAAENTAPASTMAASTLPTNPSRSALAMQAAGALGRGGGLQSSPSSGPLGWATSVPPPGSPLVARVEGWRSASLMAQVLELERIDVHALVMEDFRATVGLASNPSLNITRGLARQQHPQSAGVGQAHCPAPLHSPPRLQQQRSPHATYASAPSVPAPAPQFEQQPLLSQAQSRGQQQHSVQQPSTTLAPRVSSSQWQGRPSTWLRQLVATEEEGEGRKGTGAPADADGSRSSGGDMSGDAGFGRQSGRVESNSLASPSSSQGSVTANAPLSICAQQLRLSQRQQPSALTHSHSRQSTSQVPAKVQTQAQIKQLQPQPGNGNNRPEGTWLDEDSQCVSNQALPVSTSNGISGCGSGGVAGAGAGQARNRLRFPTMSTSEALHVEVSGPIESDPVLAKLPEWVRKGIGLPPAVVRNVESQPHSHTVTMAQSIPPSLVATHGVITEHRFEGSGGADAGGSHARSAALGSTASGHSDAAASIRPALLRGFSINKQSAVRFAPLENYLSAIVAEEEEEAVGIPATGSRLAAAEADDNERNAILVSSMMRPLAEEVEEYDKRSSFERSVSVLSYSEQAQGASGTLPLRDEIEGGFPPCAWTWTDVRAHTSDLRQQPAGSLVSDHAVMAPVNGCEARLEVAERSSLASWEESVLSHRTSAGRVSLHGRMEEHVPSGARHQAYPRHPHHHHLHHQQQPQLVKEESGNSQRMSDDDVVELYEQLMARPSPLDSPQGIAKSTPLPGAESVPHDQHVLNDHSNSHVHGLGQLASEQWPPSGSSRLHQADGGGSNGSNSRPNTLQTHRQRSPLAQPKAPRPGTTASLLTMSAALLPSAAVIVAAAEAAVAAECSSEENTASRAAVGCIWSAEYVPCSGDGVAAGRPVVRLNNTALLRLQATYGGEVIAAAGAALGLGGSSPATRKVASKELMQALTAQGSGRMVSGVQIGPSLNGSRASATPPPSDSKSTVAAVSLRDEGTLAANLSTGGSSYMMLRPRSSSGTGGDGGGGINMPQRRLSSSSSSHTVFLPHDVVSFGRQITRQASQRSSENGDAAAPGGGGRSRSIKRPISAQQAAASRPPLPRSASSRPPGSPKPHLAEATRATAATARPSAAGGPAARPHGTLGGPSSPYAHVKQQRIRPATAHVAVGTAGGSASGWRHSASALSRGPSSRPSSAVPGTSHLPPTVTITRVRQMGNEDLATCFMTVPVVGISPVTFDGDTAGHAACAAGPKPASPAMAKQPSLISSAPLPGRGSEPNLPGVPGRVPSLTSVGMGPGTGVGDRRAAGQASPRGGASSGGSSMQSSRGSAGTVELSGREERRPRQLEVMGTWALMKTPGMHGMDSVDTMMRRR